MHSVPGCMRMKKDAKAIILGCGALLLYNAGVVYGLFIHFILH